MVQKYDEKRDMTVLFQPFMATAEPIRAAQKKLKIQRLGIPKHLVKTKHCMVYNLNAFSLEQVLHLKRIAKMHSSGQSPEAVYHAMRRNRRQHSETRVHGVAHHAR
jgi:hypothetical protein